MTPLERAALAIYQVDYPGQTLPGLTDDGSWHMEVARAVLAAIREPSEGMCEAGRTAVRDDGVPGWRAMIDAALEEG